jgi:hypothetical protein
MVASRRRRWRDRIIPRPTRRADAWRALTSTPSPLDHRPMQLTRRARRIGRLGLAASLAVLAVGLVTAIGSAVAGGGWMEAAMPWVEVGMRLSTIGLLAGAAFGGLRVAVEPIGWWRLLAIPSGAVLATFWLLAFVVGLPTANGPEADVAVVLYSLPSLFAVVVAATLVTAAVPPVARRLGGARPAGA